MRNKTLASILSMESAGVTTDFKRKMVLKVNRSYSLSQEGLFDFFRKNKEDNSASDKNKDFNLEASEYKQTLLSANKVSIHLYTLSVDEEIRFLQELINAGLPVFKKDIDRLEKCFKFVLNKKLKTIDNLDGLVDISYLDQSYKYNEKLKALDFNTFIVPVIGMASSKELQKEIGASHAVVDLANSIEEIDGKFLDEISSEELARYEKMYFLEEAVPFLDEIIPKKIASGNQKVIYLEKDDPKLKTLLDLNVELIDKSFKILAEDHSDNDYSGDFYKLWKIAYSADKASQPVDIGDDFGLSVIAHHYVNYQKSIAGGFRKTFIKNYTAH